MSSRVVGTSDTKQIRTAVMLEFCPGKSGHSLYDYSEIIIFSAQICYFSAEIAGEVKVVRVGRIVAVGESTAVFPDYLNFRIDLCDIFEVVLYRRCVQTELNMKLGIFFIEFASHEIDPINDRFGNNDTVTYASAGLGKGLKIYSVCTRGKIGVLVYFKYLIGKRFPVASGNEINGSHILVVPAPRVSPYNSDTARMSVFYYIFGVQRTKIVPDNYLVKTKFCHIVEKALVIVYAVSPGPNGAFFYCGRGKT